MKEYNEKLSRGLSAVLAAFMLIGIAILPCRAEYKLSPALDIIAEEYKIAKSGLVGTDICFDKSDFTESLGISSVGKITVTSLPDVTLGRLKLGTRWVEVGQTISEKNLDSLKFVPFGSNEIAATFGFCRGSDIYGTEYECTVYTLKTVNTAPTIESASSVSTTADAYSGVAYYGTLKATDAEGDALTFEILSNASNGTVRLTDRNRGYYEYTSDKSFTGKDSFTVRVTDKYGNRSAEEKITLRVDKAESGEVFADMDGHWANSAVISCVRSGIINTAQDGDRFYPDERISRAQFLYLAMSAAGYSGFTTTNTGFADDADIPAEYKGCIAVADAMGIIEGAVYDSTVKFHPNNQITRCEAAMIISRLTGISGDTVSVFADSDTIPAWAKGAMYGLYNEGILRGNGDGTLGAYSPLTRGEAAQMISATAKFSA
ncbi:MAG: S-layer homology domain-containing protein [Clostridia bacterium]|nr:S-layer homology domain-containing protein [Clostridia bacterium]